MLILDYIFFKGLTEVIWYGVLAGAFVAWIASFVMKLYRIPLQIVSVAALILGVYNLGILANEAKWDARMEDAKRQVKEAEVETERMNERLAEENAKARGELDKANAKHKDTANKLDRALTDALAAKNGQPATPQTVIQNLSDDERKKYENMSAEQKQKYEDEIAALIKNAKECPIVPKIIIDQMNSAAAARAKKADNKGEKK